MLSLTDHSCLGPFFFAAGLCSDDVGFFPYFQCAGDLPFLREALLEALSWCSASFFLIISFLVLLPTVLPGFYNTLYRRASVACSSSVPPVVALFAQPVHCRVVATVTKMAADWATYLVRRARVVCVLSIALHIARY